MLEKIWFHYRNESRLRADLERGEKMILPHGRFIRFGDGSPTLPEKARDAAIWGFHCPEPDICITPTPERHPHIAKTKEDVANGEKLHLLRITSLPSDELYVADTGVFIGIRDERFPDDVEWDSLKGKRLRAEFKKRADPTYDRYWQSLIPFDRYQIGQYTEPEVICFTPIPFERVQCLRTIEDYCRPAPDISIDELFRDL